MEENFLGFVLICAFYKEKKKKKEEEEEEEEEKFWELMVVKGRR